MYKWMSLEAVPYSLMMLGCFRPHKWSSYYRTQNQSQCVNSTSLYLLGTALRSRDLFDGYLTSEALHSASEDYTRCTLPNLVLNGEVTEVSKVQLPVVMLLYIV